MNGFSESRQGTGTREWSEHSANIGSGCQHGCRYCYARVNALRFKKIASRDEWLMERFRPAAVQQVWGKKDGVVMFPTVHDITPYYLAPSIVVLRKMLKAGNRVLVVTKPHLVCVDQITDQLEQWKDQVLLRFTIGSMDTSLTRFWEPGAPFPQERLESLKLAHWRGWQTSVSMEPMLAGVEDAEVTCGTVLPFVSERVWIGKMNKVRQRLDMNNPEERQAAEGIERLQADGQIWQLFRALDGHPKVAWKDSIKQVIKTYEEDTCAVR